MARILAAMVFGAALLCAGVAWWVHGDPCLARCGAGTRCAQQQCIPSFSTAPPPPAPIKERRHHAHSSAATSASNDPLAPPEETLHPGDEKMVALGDALGRPERIDLSQTGPDEKELGQDEIDRVMHGAEPAIFRCMTDAVGSAPLDGKVEIGLRIEKSGAVSRVRVEGPQLLQKRGLTRCVRPIVLGLTFPKSGGASVVTYPYELK